MSRINRFQSNLQFGQRYEQLALPYLGDFVKAEFAPQNRIFKDWDIKLTLKDGSTETYEIKTDRRCFRTGNFFIKTGDEFDKPAGLRTSKADYYVLIEVDALGNIICVYIIDTQRLRELGNDNTHRRMAPPMSESFGFLLPQKTLDKMSEEFENNNGM